MSASGFVGADVVTRTVLPIEGRPSGLLRCDGSRPAAGGSGRDTARRYYGLGGRLDLQKTWDALQKPMKGESNEEISTKVSDLVQPEAATVVLPPDVFKSLGDRWCFYNSPREGGMVLTGLTGVVPITDRQQFSKHYEVLTRLVTQALPPDDGSGGPRIRHFPLPAVKSITLESVT